MNNLTRSFLALAVLSAAAPAAAQPLPPAPPPGAAPAAPAPPPPVSPAPPGAPAPEATAPGGAVSPADALNPPPPPPPPAPPPVIAPAPVVLAPAPAEPLPDRLSIGKSGGFLQPGLLLQFWGLYRRIDRTETYFRVRRAELRVKGEIAPGLVGFNLMGDLVKGTFNETRINVTPATAGEPSPGSVTVLQPGNDRAILQDFYITFMSEYADVSLGQFKTPVSLEGYGSSSKLLFPERAMVSTNYGDRRDLGLRVEKKIGKNFYYYAGLFNGFSLNRNDDDNEKDGALRLEAYPVDGLTLGVVGYTTIGERDGTTRDRLEGDLRYDANNVLLQAEYIHGWNDTAALAQVEGHGAYVGLGYTFVDRIQPIVRLGFFNPNIDLDNDQTTHYEAGLNYFLRGNEVKLSLAFSFFNPQVGTSTKDLLLAAQASF